MEQKLENLLNELRNNGYSQNDIKMIIRDDIGIASLENASPDLINSACQVLEGYLSFAKKSRSNIK